MRMITTCLLLLFGCDRSEDFFRLRTYPAPSEMPRDASVAPVIVYVDAGMADATPMQPPPATTAKSAPKRKPKRGKASAPSKPKVETQDEERTRGLANGVSCTYSSDCASGECTYHVCVEPHGDKKLGNGVACTYSSDCASGECTYHKCVSTRGDGKQLGTGVECTYSSDCASGSCTYHVCTDD